MESEWAVLCVPGKKDDECKGIAGQRDYTTHITHAVWIRFEAGNRL